MFNYGLKKEKKDKSNKLINDKEAYIPVNYSWRILMDSKNKLIALIRIRGTVGVRKDIAETLKRLNLPHVNNLSLVRADLATMGMIKKCKDYITYGEISEETLAKILKKQNKEEGAVKELIEGSRNIKEALEIPVRLHPPRHGYEGVKRPYGHGGSIGYRGNAINELINRML